jgi:hypothetical protein
VGVANLTVVLVSIVVRGQQVEVEEDVPEADIQGLPEEPPAIGGILSTSSETHLEHRPSENLDTLPYDDSQLDGNCIRSYN